MRFGIITVTYNDAENLVETIKSVKIQTYNNYEYIIINGNSMDNTSDVLSTYKNDIDVIISEPDNGLYDAMNKGVKISNADYLIFLNSGDLFAENITLERLANIIADTNLDFIYGDSIEFNSNGDIFYKKARSHKKIWYGMFTHHQSMVYKRNILTKNEILYDTKYKIAADYQFTYLTLKNSKKIFKVDFPIAKFLQGGISQKNSNEGASEQLRIKKELIKMPLLAGKSILLLQKIMKSVRVRYPKLYSIVRFKKK